MKTLHIQLEDESHKRLKGYAVEHGFSMKQVIEEFIEVSLGVIELAQQVKVSKPTPAPTPEKNKSVGKQNKLPFANGLTTFIDTSRLPTSAVRQAPDYCGVGHILSPNSKKCLQKGCKYAK